MRDIEARGLDPDVYANAPGTTRGQGGGVAVIAGKPFVLFLDLPLLRGDEPPSAGYVAAAQNPWPGPIAFYRSPEDSGFQLKAMVLAPAVTGVTLDPLPAGATSRFDRATSVRVKLDQGTLASVTELALLGGANLAAIRNNDGQWEVLQFRSAVLAAPATYQLTGFLRGQAGTEHAMRPPLAAGARFVLLDGALARVDMTQDEIGLSYNWRCGPASRDIGSPHYLDAAHAFSGEGLEPLSPVHVRGVRSAGDLDLTWIRRTRIGGDSWDDVDVPLGEDDERYEIDILDGSTVNQGVTGAARLLQEAVGAAIDGEIGPETLAQVAAQPITATLAGYADARRRHYRSLSTFWRFGKGWLARVDRTLAAAGAIARALPSALPSQQQEQTPMADATQTPATPETKWWGQSMTIWGVIITTLSTVLPVVGPLLGLDITAELIRQLGDQLVVVVQAVGGLVGTILTIWGRARATTSLERRQITLNM